ncbi:ATP-dependent DNA ligase [Asanoa siamensis]|uniref:DNA ligase (ATP) n=1 Tax=Asanoa siamensis TaxID=926357 RepID=A0ABQ4CYL1_9ACTN|nr:ATP-dependent DNA ligase [Asanoa siamensis]GIF76379.1 ATP-dependent DNA ligase [Asanoa siamensis]
MQLPVMPPVQPMLARSVTEIPDDRFYEPKWDGFRSIVFRDGDEVEVGSRNERPMTRYFPEIVAAVRESLPPRCVVDGEIVIASTDTRGLDFGALQLRLHPAASRVRLLAEQTPASFIAFDLLALGDDDYTGRPFHELRAALEQALRGARPPVHLTPITTDREVARRWFDLFEGAGLDGLIAKSGEETYQPNKRVMAKIKHERTADCVVAGYRVHKTEPEAIGSLLLGLYDDPANPMLPAAYREYGGGSNLSSVGVIGAFPMARRKELFAELQPLVTDFAHHPWNWAAAFEGTTSETRREASRWNPEKDLSFVPLRPERVVEVRYDHLEGHRFRHTAQFVRWRPDREPESCGYDQLDQPVRFDVADVLAGRIAPE